MEFPEAFFATAAGAFPLLMVAIVVAVRFNFGAATKLHAQSSQYISKADAIVDDLLRIIKEEKQTITDAASKGDSKAASNALERFEAAGNMLTRAQEIQGELPQAQAEVGRIARSFQRWAVIFAAVFAVGEASTFVGLAVGVNHKWVHDYLGPIALGTLALMIVLSAGALVIQSLHVDESEEDE